MPNQAREIIKCRTIFLAVICTACAIGGCSRSAVKTDVVAEGVIYSVEYQLENGRTGGFTRLNDSKAVPGGNGSWNVDAYGRLTHEYLLITNPQHHNLGPEVIPSGRLVNLQFGDGGIKAVNENSPNP